MESYEKIARILRTDKDVIKNVQDKLGKITGKSRMLDEICGDNEAIMLEKLIFLGLDKNSSAKQIFDALIEKINRDDKTLNSVLGNPCHFEVGGCEKIIEAVSSVSGKKDGFFIKKDKFIEILEKEPPKKILSALGYQSVSEMLKKEDWREVASALRFVEGAEWINMFFIRHYQDLSSSDFEIRPIEIIPISDRWKELAQKFVEKKYHNISHLKELGIIFVIPISLDIPGELIRTVALLFHYINEVSFYSDIFSAIGGSASGGKKIINNNFFEDFSSLLRGDVIDSKDLIKEGDWMVTQRYLAKDDENDWRLFYPHVNPEALHWEKAEKNVVELAKKYGLDGNFAFWAGLNWIGDYFPTDTGIEVLVSFNLIDTSMALVKKVEMIKYLYHHQESLWNKIFSSYFGEEKMEEMTKENITKGFISL